MLVKFLWGSSSDNFVLIIAIIKSNSFHLLDLSVFQSYRVFILICGPSSYNEISYFYTELLAHINPLLNPLVYVLCSKQYRVSVNELFTKCSCKGRCGFCGHTFYLKGKWKRDNLRFIKPASWLLHRSNISLVFPSNLSRSFNSLCTDVPPPSEKNRGKRRWTARRYIFHFLNEKCQYLYLRFPTRINAAALFPYILKFKNSQIANYFVVLIAGH